MLESLQQAIQALREKLEGMTVECPVCVQPDQIGPRTPCTWGPSGLETVDGCGGSGFRPDPQYAPLLALVREECQGFRGCPNYPKYSGEKHFHTRTDWGRDEGDLVGPLAHQVHLLCQAARAIPLEASQKEATTWYWLNCRILDCIRAYSPNLAAAKVLLEALGR